MQIGLLFTPKVIIKSWIQFLRPYPKTIIGSFIATGKKHETNNISFKQKDLLEKNWYIICTQQFSKKDINWYLIHIIP